MLTSQGQLQSTDFSLDFPLSLDKARWQADFRTCCSDFCVQEVMDIPFSGEGEHLCLLIRKEGQNSRWVAKCLTEAFGTEEMAIGFCGLKDRWAITTQWFSVHLPRLSGNEQLPNLPKIEGCQYLQQSWHGRKLRRGQHRANHFSIRLRHLTGNREALEQRLLSLGARGVPNYFGEQRFGREGGNLREAARILSRDRPRFRGQRGGLYLSAARAWMFNLVLAERVRTDQWRTPLEGEAVPEGPLWGRGRSGTVPAVAALESRVLFPWQSWCQGLEHSGLQQERRPLVLLPEGFQWQWFDSDLQLDFLLPTGTFATVLLREIALLNNRSAVL